ncbi:hypothetical protein NY2A_b517L [Paramecium bursaria Chlorella virus NY2A]|uniref:Uncharacterized protein b517L n=1 Tax=Paramecium bursaria Chlorella virus NY2A TaxID=46021 RepID=A7IX42_PBCVN|nr:hypothetical protein NY2A_b517L [Paramecium bursaria Chlorella virus NY2A]YP_001498538.1 hypothetical protein AR158_c457L [Paramecium bursaria Chlorella virus AR158]ABT14916.1 hypothetical protein NY2A_b517L [Paramecium bursaria Chlorella virus NY2A]ABU44002.1 hypothetical protein AR158_c457L [Paramecium bursaria Chlorella virus AR158]
MSPSFEVRNFSSHVCLSPCDCFSSDLFLLQILISILLVKLFLQLVNLFVRKHRLSHIHHNEHYDEYSGRMYSRSIGSL